MLIALALHGLTLILVVGVYLRWMDDESVMGLACVALFGELLGLFALARYASLTDTLLLLHAGTIEIGAAYPQIRLLFGFDELSGFFFSILAFALVICFFFLVEYFEFDSGGASIIWLSSLFSQLVLFFFCTFDLFFLLLLWELIGIVSFFLVQHWAFRLVTLKAGLKVFAYSQCGDYLFILFFFLLVTQASTTDLFTIFALAPVWAFDYFSLGFFFFHEMTLLTALLSFATFLKAAQFFFYPWLLDAMEAPVPISAQLHSSTLVIIGFYLSFRFITFFQWAPGLACLWIVVGVLTVVGASCLGFMQTDGKRLLACSTASQLGYVVTAFGLGFHAEALYLLAFCCCNKAFTFIWFGALMHRTAGLSDLRFIGGWAQLRWVERTGLLVSILHFTVWPGVFSWHVKTLFAHNFSSGISSPSTLAVEILQLTWFFSALYLVMLASALFFQSLRGSSANQLYPFWANFSKGSSETVASWPLFFPTLNFFYTASSFSTFSFCFVACLCLGSLCLSVAGSNFFLIYVEPQWALNSLVLSLSYF